jgi:L-serine kinase (ADP)
MNIEEIGIDCLIPHEEIEEKRIQEIITSLKNGQLEPILVAREHNVVLDGHHRVEAARRLGWDKIKCRVVDYDNEVDLGFWQDEIRCSKCDVILLAVSGFKFPPKTTKHTLCLKCNEK